MKFSVTPELATLVRTLRTQQNLSSKDLAERLGKSPSYLSKFEKGEVKSVQHDVLRRFFELIFEGRSFYDEILPVLVRTIESFCEPDRFAYQVWLIQFDVMERRIAIPGDMIDDIKSEMENLGVDAGRICDLINANYDSEMGAGFEPNQCVAVDYEGQPRLLVRVRTEPATLDRVLQKKQREWTYHQLSNLVYCMFRQMNFPDVQEKLPPEAAVKVLRLVASYMDRWDVHSLVHFSRFLSSDEFISRQAPLVHEDDLILRKVGSIMESISKSDTLQTTNQMNAFYETLMWDPGFAMKLISIPFSDLGNLSYSKKRQLLAEIAKLVDCYDQMPELERRLETY